jgi:predicted RNase H-like nuclease
MAAGAKLNAESVIGVDGCPGGWIAAIWEGDKLKTKLFELRQFVEILDEPAAMIAVDMPIGFPENYGRSADREARKALLPFGSRVFPVPCREAIHAANYTEAIRLNKLRSDGVSIPPVTNAIRPRMQEIDKLMSVEIEKRLREVHPEVCFCVMNGGVPLAHKKKTLEGERQRLELLRSSGFPTLDWNELSYRRSQVKRDDIVDACAAAWTARRILENRAKHFPESEERDNLGLLMRIHA